MQFWEPVAPRLFVMGGSLTSAHHAEGAPASVWHMSGKIVVLDLPPRRKPRALRFSWIPQPKLLLPWHRYLDLHTIRDFDRLLITNI